MRHIIWLIVVFFPVIGFSLEKPVIILDPGHGGKDKGARVRQLQENRLTLRTSDGIKKHLELLGYRVILTRSKDVFVPLSSRVAMANSRSSSLFVSVHYNSAPSTAAKGFEIYYCAQGEKKRRDASMALAHAVLGQMVAQTSGVSRGVKKGNFQVIRDTSVPAILVEAGFLSNREEHGLIGTQIYLDKLAKGIAMGIDKYVQLKR